MILPNPRPTAAQRSILAALATGERIISQINLLGRETDARTTSGRIVIMKTVRLMEASGWIEKLDITPQEWSISPLGLQVISAGEAPSVVLDVDRQLFAALIAGNVKSLDELLADSFLLIDPNGSVITKPALLAALASGQLRFEAIDPAECRVRSYLTAAAVTGLARIRGYFNARPFDVCGRYTHVYIEQNGGWRLITAQVTPIKEG